MVPDPDAEYRLFDRVVNVRESFTVPLGLRGTVIGIKGGEYIHYHFIQPLISLYTNKASALFTRTVHEKIYNIILS